VFLNPFSSNFFFLFSLKYNRLSLTVTAAAVTAAAAAAAAATVAALFVKVRIELLPCRGKMGLLLSLDVTDFITNDTFETKDRLGVFPYAHIVL
jgi:hypothetical protein